MTHCRWSDLTRAAYFGQSNMKSCLMLIRYGFPSLMYLSLFWPDFTSVRHRKNLRNKTSCYLLFRLLCSARWNEDSAWDKSEDKSGKTQRISGVNIYDRMEHIREYVLNSHTPLTLFCYSTQTSSLGSRAEWMDLGGKGRYMPWGLGESLMMCC